MEFVYLGFLETLETAIEKTITPLITLVFNAVMGVLLNVIGILLKDFLFTFWLHAFRVILKGISILVRVLDILSGMTNVSFKAVGAEDTSLLSYFLRASSISRFFLAMTMGAMALAFIFAVFRTGKIISDSALEADAKPISSVLSGGFRCMLAFMMVPILCIGCLQFSTVITKEIRIAFESTGKEAGVRTEFSDVLFELAAESGLKVKKSDPKYENEFWKYDQPYQNVELLQAEKVYDLKKIDYFIGIPTSFILLVILLGSCLAFVRRIIDVLVLYVVSPYFAATIALDGGSRFQKWREKFIGTFFGCFGSVFAMRLYLILIPMIATDSFRISGNTQVNYIAKICFVIGSAWAIFKSQGMITQLISPSAAQGTNESSALMSGLAFGAGRRFGRGVSGLGSALTAGKTGKKTAGK